jgi:hypothetical protein
MSAALALFVPSADKASWMAFGSLLSRPRRQTRPLSVQSGFTLPKIALAPLGPAPRESRRGSDSTLMKWRALATDFDGTIATDAVVDEPTQLALVRLRSANVRTLLVTGRELSDFEAMGSFLTIFDMIVADNGAVLFDPASGEIRTLSAPPPEAFIAELSRRGVSPLGVGSSIVATREPHQATVLEVIKELGLELQVILQRSGDGPAIWNQ